MAAEAQKLELDALLELASDSSAESRRALVSIVADLFAEQGAVLSDRERALMADILAKLLQQLETDVRRELAARLADDPSLPPDLAVLLANDEVEVARPVLLRSPVLRDDELISIVHHRTVEHQLAVAQRRSLGARVSAALAATDNEDVIRALLDNGDAEISAATMEYLVEQSRRVDAYQEPLLRRRDLPAPLAQRMYWWVSAALRAHILGNYCIEPTRLDEQIEAAVGRLADRPSGPSETDGGSAAERLARRLAAEGRITADLLVRVLRQGEVMLFEQLFACLADLRPDRVRQMMTDPTGRGLTVACRALDVGRESFASLYLLRYQSTDSRVRDPRDLSRILKLYDSIRRTDAIQVLALWQRNPNYLEAIEQLGAA